MIEELPQPLLPFKLSKIISDEVVNTTEGRKLSKEETVLQVLQNLLMGVLVRNGEVYQACFMFYSLYNKGESMERMPENHLIQWICRPPVRTLIAKQIQQQYDNIVPHEEIQEERLPIDAPASPTTSPFLVKIEAHTQYSASNSDYSAKSNKKRESGSNIFEVINLCSQESSYQCSEVHESNQEVMIYTHEQIMEQLNFELERHGKQVDAIVPQPIEEESQDCVQGLREVSERQLLELMNEQSCLSSSSLCGHFLFGDKIDSILDAFCCSGNTYFLISWCPRPKCPTLTPNPSLLPAESLKCHAPHQLIQFYQSKFESIQ